ncbi:MAG: 3-deoxy-manno-octulosonate cytidylyltransferase [Gammaproteobacteria bacterium]|nr:3-deoxy-manno-octulosonate cytidylyltransferase [Gammaproteobacteria bacterium]
MSFIVVIPARFASTRLPGKPLLDIGGKPLIQHVVERANESDAARVILATDDERIAEAASNFDCETCMTRADHLSGSDRLEEVVQTLAITDPTSVVNVQGDEPFVPARLINNVAAALTRAPDAAMATAAHRLREIDDFHDRNVVKVVFDQHGRALYFSRSPIPFGAIDQAWRHIGIYAYRAEFLKRYGQLNPSALEHAESLEQLRVMDNGETIMVQAVDYDSGIGVDTEQDLEQARKIAQDLGITS